MLAILPFDADEATVYRQRLTEDEMDESWHLVQPNGTRLQKKPAAMALLEYLHATRALGRLFRTLRLGWVVALGNEFFNLIRVKAGRCVPDVPRTVRWP